MRRRGGLICDLGNVVIGYWLSTISGPTFSSIDYNQIPEVPGAFDGLNRFAGYYGANVTICYNATDVAQGKIWEWLAYHDFEGRTGITLDRVVHSKHGRDKTSFIDQSTLTYFGTTVVIDDRLEVLNHFVGHVENLFLFRPQDDEVNQFNSTGTLGQVMVVQCWDEILRAVRERNL